MTERRRPRVRPYPLADLPRLLQVQVELSRVLWRHLAPVLDAAAAATPAGWARLLEGLGGPLSLRAQEPYLFPVTRAAEWLQGGAVIGIEALGLGPGSRWALLAVDQALLDARGLSAEDLGRLLRAALLGAAVRVQVPAPEAAGLLGGDEAMGLGLDLALELGGAGRSWARLLTGAGLRLAAPPPAEGATAERLWQRRGRLRHVPVTLIIEAGYGIMPGLDLATLEPGDVVLLDRFGPRPVVGGPVWLRLGRGTFPAHLDGGGVTVAGPYESEGTIMAKEDLTATGEERGPAQGERLLHELPVQVTCEIGRITLSGKQVLEMRPGTVLAVGRPLAGPVDLTAGGRLIARGELVDVEGEIGVRVTEVIE